MKPRPSWLARVLRPSGTAGRSTLHSLRPVPSSRHSWRSSRSQRVPEPSAARRSSVARSRGLSSSRARSSVIGCQPSLALSITKIGLPAASACWPPCADVAHELSDSVTRSTRWLRGWSVRNRPHEGSAVAKTKPCGTVCTRLGAGIGVRSPATPSGDQERQLRAGARPWRSASRFSVMRPSSSRDALGQSPPMKSTWSLAAVQASGPKTPRERSGGDTTSTVSSVGSATMAMRSRPTRATAAKRPSGEMRTTPGPGSSQAERRSPGLASL